MDYAIGRDIKPSDIDVIVNCLQEWCSACEGVLGSVESQIHRANSQKNKSVSRKAEIEQEVLNSYFKICFVKLIRFYSDCQH